MSHHGVGIMIAGTNGVGWEKFSKFSGGGMGFGINCAGTDGDGGSLGNSMQLGL